jgi:hypothetical protein
LARSMDTILTARKDGLKAHEDHKKQFHDLKELFCSFLSELLLEIADLKEISSKTDAPPPREAPASKKDSDAAARYGEAKAVADLGMSWLPTSSNCGLNDHQESNAAAAQRVMMWLPDREQAEENEKERTMSLLAAAQRGPAEAKVAILAKIGSGVSLDVGAATGAENISKILADFETERQSFATERKAFEETQKVLYIRNMRGEGWSLARLEHARPALYFDPLSAASA